jgi:hypothetical protein
MYEKPNLNRVGEAQDVILGCYSLGDDIDHTYVDGNDEYAFDGDDRDCTTPRA